MRVIAGRFRGRRLGKAPPGVRPTSDRVRERLFAVLEGRLPGAYVVDLCCGTGSLGIEALSRGATCALFVDRAPASLAALERNLAPLRAAAPELELTLRREEAERFVAAHWPERAVAGVFLDPPYRDPVGERILALLAAKEAGAWDWIVYESEDRELAPPAGTAIGRVLRFGDTRITLLERGERP